MLLSHPPPTSPHPQVPAWSRVMVTVTHLRVSLHDAVSALRMTGGNADLLQVGHVI